MKKKENKFKTARMASNMTIEQAAKAAGLAMATYQLRERKPDDFRIKELRGLYASMTETAKPILRDAVRDIFLS